MGDRPRPPAPPVIGRSCGEPLPEGLYPDGCSAQAQYCGLSMGHQGEHKSWVSMAPAIVRWPDELPASGRRPSPVWTSDIRVTGNLFVIVCDDCGALVPDIKKHAAWHAANGRSTDE